MKIVVIGGSGLIGAKLVSKFTAAGHEAVAASPKSGVDALTGEGLADVLKGAQVVVDVANSPSFEDAAVLEFFTKSTGNLMKYEAEAGVGHHVVLSVVGTQLLPESGYFRAKFAQEELIRKSSIPYSIVHATQFFEFVKVIAGAGVVGDKIHMPPILIQPIAAEDVASAVAEVAMGKPLNGEIEIAGPEAYRMDELIRKAAKAYGDTREVVTDAKAGYFGMQAGERTLVPAGEARLGTMHFEAWLAAQ